MRRAHILNTYAKMIPKKWDTIYWTVDIHDTCIKANYKAGDIPTEFYPGAMEALQRISNRPDSCLIMWTCSYPHEIEQYVELFKSKGINFKYINCNPEAKDTAFGYFKDKFYTNLILDDKADFIPSDWKNVTEALDILDQNVGFDFRATKVVDEYAPIVVKEFASDVEMGRWLANEKNTEDLKLQYPPAIWNGSVSLVDKQVLITKIKK